MAAINQVFRKPAPLLLIYDQNSHRLDAMLLFNVSLNIFSYVVSACTFIPWSIAYFTASTVKNKDVLGMFGTTI